MIAVDTNILVRFLSNDDPAQTARCQRLMESHEVYVSLTVLLETEWVLRSAHRYAPRQVKQAFLTLLGLQNVTVENPTLLATVFDCVEAGMDFADALHLANAADCDGFVTFDQRLIQTAAALGIANVGEP